MNNGLSPFTRVQNILNPERKTEPCCWKAGRAVVSLQGGDGDGDSGLEMARFSIWVLLVARDCSPCENALTCTFMISVCVLCYTSIKLLLLFLIQ